MYSITIQVDGKETFSHAFDTRKAADKWFRWCASQRFVEQAKLYRGQPGGELLDTRVCTHCSHIPLDMGVPAMLKALQSEDNGFASLEDAR